MLSASPVSIVMAACDGEVSTRLLTNEDNRVSREVSYAPESCWEACGVVMRVGC